MRLWTSSRVSCEEARAHYHTGNDKYAAGEYEAAASAFEKADAIMGVPTTGLGLGKSQTKIGKLIEAYATLQRVARHPKESDEPAEFAEARDEATRLVPDIAARIPSVVLQVTGVKQGTSVNVKVDGTVLAIPVGVLETSFQVNPGTHDIAVSASGYTDGALSFEIVEAEKKAVAVAMALLPEKGGGGNKPKPKSDDNTATEAVMWSGFALGAAGIIAGAITGGVSLSITGDIDTTCGADSPCPEAARADHDRAIDFANASNATFVIGGVGVVAGLIALVLLVDGDEGGDAAAFRFGPGGFTVDF